MLTPIETLSDRFLLKGDTAKALYQEVRELPIFDYHCHLSPKEIYENRPCGSLGELWLAGDHYKWRLMRACGIEERLITGDVPFDEKFYAFARVLPKAAGNPIYHWVKMELKAYFGIEEPLNERTAPAILKKANAMLAEGGYSPRELIERSRVRAIFTTDDPADSLTYHQKLREEGFGVRVCPSFRPDMAVAGLTRPGFADYVQKLGASTFDEWVAALTARLDFFVENGCVITDISLDDIPPVVGDRASATAAFDAVMDGGAPDEQAVLCYFDYMLRTMAALYAERDLVMQLHLSALRNNRIGLLREAGVDSGNDSVGPALTVRHLAAFLNALDTADSLPRTIVYSLNPAPLYEIATMLGNFWHDRENKLMLGAAWWHLDHIDGITEQLKLAAATGLLGNFTGMLTDSRSFTSYPRHDYFRRILCNVVGEWVDAELYDAAEAPALVRRIAYDNAEAYFAPKA